MTLLHPWSWILKSMQNAFLNAHAGSAGLQQPQYIFSRAFGSILWISVWWGLLSCYGQAIMLSDLGWKIFLSLWRNSWLFFFFFWLPPLSLETQGSSTGLWSLAEDSGVRAQWEFFLSWANQRAQGWHGSLSLLGATGIYFGKGPPSGAGWSVFSLELSGLVADRE